MGTDPADTSGTRSTTSQLNLPATAAEKQAIRDFWEVYERYFDEIFGRTESFVLARQPAMAALLGDPSPEQLADLRRVRKEVLRQAIVEENWQPYLKLLRAQGASCAQAGISWAAWFGVAGALRTYATPYLLRTFSNPERLVSAMDGMNKMIDLAITAIGQEYLRTKENIILQQQQVVRESEERYRLLFDSSPLPQWVVDVETFRFLAVNESAVRHYGRSREEFLAMTIQDIGPPQDLPTFLQYWSDVVAGPQRTGDWRHCKKDGSVIFVEVTSRELTFQGRRARLVSIVDITERHRAEARVKAALKEKEVLLREIHHRVKNNLQVISSLLRLQATHIKDPLAQNAYQESHNRIRAMALLHSLLYESRDLSQIDFARYIKALMVHLFRSYGVGPDRIALEINTDHVSLDMDTAIPCGLIINELVSNSLKHAFPGDQRGEIRVEIRSEGDKYRLTVRDNGIGLPKDLDFRREESFGLQLINILGEQLEATTELRTNGGTEFVFTFSQVEYKTRR